MKNHGNTHETLERDEEPARGSNRGFGLVMASVFVLLELGHCYSETATSESER
jgi:hypothetical protein